MTAWHKAERCAGHYFHGAHGGATLWAYHRGTRMPRPAACQVRMRAAAAMLPPTRALQRQQRSELGGRQSVLALGSYGGGRGWSAAGRGAFHGRLHTPAQPWNMGFDRVNWRQGCRGRGEVAGREHGSHTTWSKCSSSLNMIGCASGRRNVTLSTCLSRVRAGWRLRGPSTSFHDTLPTPSARCLYIAADCMEC
jgi:hypothetical protein